jgi:NAD(P)-dependent dehydrogenase (short-subunit alcohol dehydrogenase family)
MDDNILGLAGRNALVVGGGNGIGRETVLLLARAGANVAVGDIISERAQAVAAEASGLGVRAHPVCGDARVETDALSMVDGSEEGLRGPLEILVNIVGIASWVTVMDIDDETWDHDLGMNLRHHLYVGRAAAKAMVASATAGRIAMVASVDGFYGSTNHPAYGVAKAGLISLTKTMAQEWGQYGIRVNAVAPDAILTPRVRQMLTEAGVAFENQESVRPLKAWGTPAEIAGPLTFLVSDLSSFVSGQTLIVDGGMFGVPGGTRAAL